MANRKDRPRRRVPSGADNLLHIDECQNIAI